MLIAATAILVAGIAMGQCLLIATGSVLAGFAGRLFPPEFPRRHGAPIRDWAPSGSRSHPSGGLPIGSPSDSGGTVLA